MPDDHGVHRLGHRPLKSLGAQALRGLTVTETRELAALRVMMRSNAYMTEAQRRRWFELWQRHDPMRG